MVLQVLARTRGLSVPAYHVLLPPLLRVRGLCPHLQVLASLLPHLLPALPRPLLIRPQVRCRAQPVLDRRLSYAVAGRVFEL